jgi:4-hydroxy-tetrahydrodipicolinate reductase
VLGRPVGRGHDRRRLAGADVAFEVSRGDAVRDNVDALLAAGCRRVVVGTTAWEADRPAVEAALRSAGASGVAAPNFSLGVALFGRLVEAAAGMFGAIDAFDPYLLEWHRRSKADRPSGTARALAARIGADAREVAVIRAGAAPGMHLVGWDAAGETIELRHTARDRTAYAAGALAAADWLLAAPRAPGLLGFDAVVDELVARPTEPPVSTEAPMPLAV